jgi:hypothetical protein
MSNEQPVNYWKYNRNGACCICGTPLDHYDTKWIEKAEPHRFVGVHCRCDVPLIEEGVIKDGLDGAWRYYTDG